MITWSRSLSWVKDTSDKPRRGRNEDEFLSSNLTFSKLFRKFEVPQVDFQILRIDILYNLKVLASSLISFFEDVDVFGPLYFDSKNLIWVITKERER